MEIRMPIIHCGSYGAVDNWIQRLRKVGYNYFVYFLDVKGPSLWYGKVDWAARDCAGGYYVG